MFPCYSSIPVISKVLNLVNDIIPPMTTVLVTGAGVAGCPLGPGPQRVLSQHPRPGPLRGNDEPYCTTEEITQGPRGISIMLWVDAVF